MDNMENMNTSTGAPSGAATAVDSSGAFADGVPGGVPRGQSPRRRIRNTCPATDARQERIVLFKLTVDGLEERRGRSLPEGEVAPGSFRQKRRNRIPRL
jgi:hypothetical protein